MTTFLQARAIRLKVATRFPSNLFGRTGTAVNKANGNYFVDLDYSTFPPATALPAPIANQYALGYDIVLKKYTLVPAAVLGGGITDAPNDGQQWCRQSANWAVVAAASSINPSNANPAMDGTAAPGVTVLYSRGDHVHPSDTSRAPIASPNLTGVPTAPTASVGTNTTQLATTAFVLANAGTASNALPIVDGVAAAGVAVTYARGDHVHPTDTSRQPADVDLTAIAALTGTGIARRTGAGTWSTGSPVVDGELATMAAFTFKGNNTAAVASPTDVDISALPTKASPAGGDFLLLSDQAASGTWKKIIINSLPGAAGGIPEAPNDGQQYARQSLGWTIITGGGASPSNANPAMDGTAAAGATLLYSRGDHVHPTDSSRAPLASPTFTGTPAGPTATAGTSTTQLATTAFVGAAVAAVPVPGPATAPPIVDGTATVGTSLLYARQDHIHPSDTTRAPLTTIALATATPYSVPATVSAAIVKLGTPAPATVNLLAASNYSKEVHVSDGAMNAGTNNITILPNGSETINGLGSWKLAGDGAGVTLYPVAGVGWFT